MIDLRGLPEPENAPAPGTCVKLERPENGLIVLRLDPPHRKMTVLDLPLIRDLDRALDEVERDRALKGLVVTGKDPLNFAAGADIDAIESVTDPELVRRFVRVVQDVFQRIHDLSAGMQRVMTVAAVGGPVPGGAYELSLACERIVAADSKKTRIGLPETQLGIIPGWGGCQRLPRRVGVPTALEAILSGKLYPARQAYKKGMIDRVTPPEYVERIACEIAMGRISCKRRRRGLKGLFVDRNPLATGILASMAKKKVLAQTKGHYPAPLRAIGLVTRAPRTRLLDGFEAEARATSALATGSVSKSLIGIFRMSEEAKKLGRFPDDRKVEPLESAGVLGAGIMGGAIASVLAGRGLRTRLFDISQEALDVALLEHRADIDKRLQRRRLEKHEAMAALDHLDTTVELIGFQRSQIVIEAVAERLEIKRSVLGSLCEQVGPDAIVATNTSSLSVDAIAESLPNPERVCGMHFFNPVRRMPLVEIVRGSHTHDDVVTRVAALALRMGKTPVVVKDVAGFLVNRLLGPYLDEALRMLTAGVPAEKLDAVAERFGMPMGPLTLLDEVGLDIASHAAESLHDAYGERMTPSNAIQGLIAEGRLGKKTGRGFYEHTAGRGSKSSARKTLSPDLSSFVPVQSDALAGASDEEILDRLLLSMVNEAARCLEEGVVASPSELDLATIFGMGFPPFHGGLLRWADSVGTAEIVARLERIASAPDVVAREGGVAKFTPAALLSELSRGGERFRAPRLLVAS